MTGMPCPLVDVVDRPLSLSVSMLIKLRAEVLYRRVIVRKDGRRSTSLEVV